MSRLSSVEVYAVDVSEKTTWLLLRLVGPDGAEGVGEATLNSRTDEVLAAVPRCAAAASGEVFGTTAKLAAARGAVPGLIGRVVASALEQAWLDREGRRLGKPEHALLGGCFRERVRCYANINRGTLSRRPDEFAARAVLAAADGYAAIKFAPFDGVTAGSGDEEARAALIEAGVARVAAVVAALDGKADVYVDCHSRFRLEEAGRMLTRLADVGIAWLEEPVKETDDAPEALAHLRAVAHSLGVTLAGAENAANLAAFMPFCSAGSYDVVMPDIILGGGPAEVVRIGHFAAAHGSAISLHNPCGPVMDMHSAHVAAAVPEVHSLERQFRESPLYDLIGKRTATLQDGHLHIGCAPGVGFEVDWTNDAMRCVVRTTIGI